MDIFWDFALRLFVAGAMGVLIGLEREYRAKEAGYRTHFLVALGSALMMIVSQYGFMEVLKTDLIRLDPSRIAAQVVSGIGFIGAGTIILQKQIVRGLTTAAGIWATSGIGLAVGAGMYAVGISATLLVLLGLETLSYFFKSIGLRNMMIDFSTDDKEAIKRVSKKFNTRNYVVVSYEMTEAYTNGKNVYHVSMVVKAKRMNEEGLLLMFLQDFPDITASTKVINTFSASKTLFIIDPVTFCITMQCTMRTNFFTGMTADAHLIFGDLCFHISPRLVPAFRSHSV